MQKAVEAALNDISTGIRQWCGQTMRSFENRQRYLLAKRNTRERISLLQQMPRG
jgi:hypothetical protein